MLAPGLPAGGGLEGFLRTTEPEKPRTSDTWLNGKPDRNRLLPSCWEAAEMGWGTRPGRAHPPREQTLHTSCAPGPANLPHRPVAVSEAGTGGSDPGVGGLQRERKGHHQGSGRPHIKEKALLWCAARPQARALRLSHPATGTRSNAAQEWGVGGREPDPHRTQGKPRHRPGQKWSSATDCSIIFSRHDGSGLAKSLMAGTTVLNVTPT